MTSDDFPLDQLVFAFSYLMTQRITGTDGATHAAEARFLAQRFPPARFTAYGFTNAAGAFTPRWHDAVGEALLELPVALSVDARLDLVETLWRAALADAELHPDEQAAVEHGARLLGLPADAVAQRLGAIGRA